jgi:organic radical activating enzyme
MRAMVGVSLSEEPNFPKNILVELSNACNHKCVFCTNPKMTRTKSLLDGEVLRDVLAQGYELGAREVGFYATGEPLVHKKLAEFIKMSRDIGYDYTYITSNGALAVAQRSEAILDAGIHSIKFSVNAGSRKTYKAVHGKDDWDKVVANIKHISNYRKKKSYDVYLAISYVTIERNRDEVDLLKSTLGQYVDEVTVVEAGPQGGYMNENFENLSSTDRAKLIKPPCHNLFSRAHITAEGLLTMCCVDYQNYLAIADLTKVSLKDAWLNPGFLAMRRLHLRAQEEGLDALKGTLCYNCMACVNTPEPAALVEEFSTPFEFKQSSDKNQLIQISRVAS